MTSSSERYVALDALMPLIRAQLAAGKTVTFSPRGVSMLPMLRQGRDSVTLSPITSPIAKYDLPLYQRENGQYVLHRVIAAGDTLTCLGDNQFDPEPGLRREQMIAVVSAFSRDGRQIAVTSPAHRFYVRLWCASRPLRRIIRRGRSFLGRIKRRLNHS